MTRPTAAYVDGMLSHPIRLAGFRGREAEFLNAEQALELVNDLVSAIQRSLERTHHETAYPARGARPLRDRD